MLKLYKTLSYVSKPLLKMWLQKRQQNNKEDADRIEERMGNPSSSRPDGRLIWLHAASVGEAQALLILIKFLKSKFDHLNILVTTGTVTSARLMKDRLPDYAIHQYYPVDHPQWVQRFFEHWRPDLVIWTESELWPNMLGYMGQHNIPIALVNARISVNSYKRWSLFPKTIGKLFNVFDIIMAQTEDDARMIQNLGARKVIVSDSLKYCADPLNVHDAMFRNFSESLANRVGWLFASTHAGEEEIACNIHMAMKEKHPNLLTFIAPRHPERREEIINLCDKKNLRVVLRSHTDAPPAPEDDIYIIDSLGELGTYYKLCGIACIGRSFSHDGGGGHNPIEAIQLGCVTLHGPNTHNFARVYRDMDVNGVSISCKDKQDLQNALEQLMSEPEKIFELQDAGANFIQQKAGIIDFVLAELNPLFVQAGLNCPSYMMGGDNIQPGAPATQKQMA